MSRETVTALFTSDPRLTEITLSMYPFLCLYANLVDSMQMPFQGMVRALGIQTLASLVAVACYYILSVPLSCVFAFVSDLGIFGLWLGLYCGVTMQFFIMIFITVRADWTQLAI